MSSKNKSITTNQLINSIKRLHYLNDYTIRECDGWSMNVNQLLVLLESAVFPEKSLGEITLSIGITQPTMWRTIDKFEERGLGKKVQDNFDHRVYYFKISPIAKDLLAVDS